MLLVTAPIPPCAQIEHDSLHHGRVERGGGNLSYTSELSGSYNFNATEKLNGQFMYSLLATKQLNEDKKYDFDFDHEFYTRKDKYISMSV